MFKRQVLYLVDNYNLVSIDQVLRAVQTGVALPPRSILLTFDDAYRDFKDIAWPILKACGVPVTVFVPTAYAGCCRAQPFWWDRLKSAIMLSPNAELKVDGRGFRLGSKEERFYAYYTTLRHISDMPHEQGMAMVTLICTALGEQQLSLPAILTWPELRVLAQEGVTLGGHSRTHPILTNISEERLREEIAGCREDLQRETGSFKPVFAYPAGRHSDLVMRILQEEGFVLAFTTAAGHNNLDSAELLRLSRTNITPRTNMPLFRLRLLDPIAFMERIGRGFRDRVAAT